jgi:hypothetical protein
MSSSEKVSKVIKLDLHIVKCIQKVASEKKISFDDAIIFLVEKVLSPTKRAN